jgi:tetratricopeptide (TPR) repeat protein
VIRLQQLRQIGTAAVVLLSFAAPDRAEAHGETLLRIATMSRRIEAATPAEAAPLYLVRGDLYREHQDWAAAEADYAQAAKLQPSLAAVDLSRARLLAQMGNLEAATAMFTKVLSHSPNEGEAFVGRARMLIKLSRREEAIGDFRRGLEKLSVPELDYFLELAQALQADKRPSEALQVLDGGIKRLGPLLPLQEQALQLELAQNDLDAALRRVERILETVPRKETWLVRQGDILLLAKKPAEAQHSFKAALQAIDSLPPILRQSPSVRLLVEHVRGNSP